MNTRAEYMAWCKKRALEYVDAGKAMEGFTSMCSDLEKHPETANHKGIDIGMMLLLYGSLTTNDQIRKFIEGFN